MAARKTANDYNILAAARRLTWLATTPPSNCDTKTDWECSYGHVFETTYHNVQASKTGCSRCGKNLRKAPAEYLEAAAQQGFTWLGPEVDNVHDKTRWRCPNGHEWLGAYAALTAVRRRGCPYCGGTSPKTSEDYVALAMKRGIEWLGPEVKNTKLATIWRCADGHEWTTTYFSIASGSGCSVCAGNLPILPDDYRRLASEKKFMWLGPVVANVSIKTRWRCEYGHEWYAPYNSLRQARRGCPHCSKLARKTPDDYHKIAAQTGLRWLGPEVTAARIKTVWRCNNGHDWETSYAIIRGGSRCPKCQDMVNGSRTSKQQRELHDALGGIMNYQVSRYSIDVALIFDEYCIAVEYDCWYWHQGKEAHDTRRDKFLIERGWRILRIKSGEQLPTTEQLDEALNHLRQGATYAEIILPDWRGDLMEA